MRRLFSIVTLAVLCVTARATTPPTPVKNVQDPVQHPYQEYAVMQCTTPGPCEIVFPAITTGLTLIQHVSCYFEVDRTANITFAVLGRVGSNPINLLQFFSYGPDSSDIAYGINADTYLFFEKGQQPYIEVNSNTAPVQGLQCTLSGYYH